MPRTFVHKCHSGYDSLVTARESYEVATRFFFGDYYARLRLVEGKVTRGKDLFGKSEYFLGVSIKPRGVDFELFHQSKQAENCYGPFSKVGPDNMVNFSEDSSELSFAWADEDRTLWEGWLNSALSLTHSDLVIRIEFYVGERDLFGVGFSDNLIFQKQYYILSNSQSDLYLFTGEEFAEPGGEAKGQKLLFDGTGWTFDVGGSGFVGTFRIELAQQPLLGEKQFLSP